RSRTVRVTASSRSRSAKAISLRLSVSCMGELYCKSRIGPQHPGSIDHHALITSSVLLFEQKGEMMSNLSTRSSLSVILVSAVMLVLGLFAGPAGAGEVLAPWASNHQPTDVPKMHVQEITAGQSSYVITQGGTMDGQNCRSPQSAYLPFQQTWESNRSVR